MKTTLQFCSVTLVLIFVTVGCNREYSNSCGVKAPHSSPPHDHTAHDHTAHDHTAHDSVSRNIFAVMMDEMMMEMDRAVTNASVEEDFLAQMLAHHKGALVMAEHEAAHGHNAEMVQLAKSIVAEQTGEVHEMEVLIDLVRSSGGTAITPEYRAAMTKTMTDMMRVLPSEVSILADLDRSFAALMRPHHQAAIDMAAVVLTYSDEPIIAHLAEKIIVAQTVEIEQMDAFLVPRSESP